MRMKKTMLLVSSSPSTSVGLRSYLTHIFGRYIKLEARLADDVTSELMEQFDLVLFASKGAARALETSMTPKIHFLICIRTFNFTYLNKILSIPPNSDVYLVNDSEQTTKSAIRLLSTYGFSQYHFVPYYPGCGEADYSIQYAVTLGEERYVPRHIPNVMDIGVRVADVSTIAEIASFFNLSMSIADVVTQNYLNQFVQLLKMSNYQVRQTTKMVCWICLYFSPPFQSTRTARYSSHRRSGCHRPATPQCSSQCIRDRRCRCRSACSVCIFRRSSFVLLSSTGFLFLYILIITLLVAKVKFFPKKFCQKGT